MSFLFEEGLFCSKRQFVILLYVSLAILILKFCASNQNLANMFHIGVLIGGADFCYKNMKKNNETQEEMQSWYSKIFSDF